MATILKENLNGSKGILSFTHKENKKLDNPITHFFLKNSLLEIKKKLVIKFILRDKNKMTYGRVKNGGK